MRLRKYSTVLALAAVLSSGATLAQPASPIHPCDLSADERAAAREARREALQGMTAEERSAALEARRLARDTRRAGARERLESMTEAEREAARERFQSRGGPAERCQRRAVEQA